jgi:hypothetical protein
MKGEDSCTPLSRAVRLRAEAVVKLLLMTGKVDPDAKDKYDRTLLSRAAQQFQDQWGDTVNQERWNHMLQDYQV